MSHFQQPVYTTYPSPAMVMNSPQPVAYGYSQHPSMQAYYAQPVQPLIVQQPGPYHQGGHLQNDCSDLTQCCMCILCLGAFSYCCAEGCCGRDDINDDCCCCC